MNGAFAQVKSHRPIVGNGVADVFHAGVNRSLRRPNMRGDIRDILRYVSEYGHEQFGVFLIFGVVIDFLEPLAVEWFPDKAVEQFRLLGDAARERIHIVLLSYHFAASRIERCQIEPIRGIAHGFCAAC